MIVKICGVSNNATAILAQSLGATCVGAVLAPGSKRFVPPEKLPEIFSGVTVRRVGVFVDADLEFIRRAVELGKLDAVQLHGSEPPKFAEQINFSEVWKAFPFTAKLDVEAVLRYPAKFILADSSRAGSGAASNWSLARSVAARRPQVADVQQERHLRALGQNAKFKHD